METYLLNDTKLTPQRGHRYEQFVEAGWPVKFLLEHSEDLSLDEIARQAIGSVGSKGTISRWMTAWREDLVLDAKGKSWAPPPSANATLEDFPAFRRRYFLDEHGNPYRTPGFHLEWVKSVLATMESGGRLMILSPPRSGKTMLLTHFAIWLILRNPNIRIMWVGPSAEIAQETVQLVREELETNEELRNDFLPPGATFRGNEWKADRITVGTRTVPMRAPTMYAIGRSGRLLSRDADLIVGDDLEDHSSTLSPTEREKTRQWWTTQLGSRKTQGTAQMCIGSRQHFDDLYSYLLKNDGWESLVYRMHDESCAEDPTDPDVHWDCMLWPEVAPYSFFLSQKEAFDMATPGTFEMVFLNHARAENSDNLTEEEINACVDWDRPLGKVPPGCRLIAGLDPATTGYQAAVLWAFDPQTGVRHLVDLSNDKAGGYMGGWEVMKDWLAAYGLRHWVIETNNAQSMYMQTREIKEWSAHNGVIMEPHFTHRVNKWDEAGGVVASFRLWRARMVSMPGQGEAAKRALRLYRGQLTAWEPKRKTVKSDIVMAGWFPETKIRDWMMESEDMGVAEVEYEQQGYPTVDWNDAPWRVA